MKTTKQLNETVSLIAISSAFDAEDLIQYKYYARASAYHQGPDSPAFKDELPVCEILADSKKDLRAKARAMKTWHHNRLNWYDVKNLHTGEDITNEF